MDLKIIKIFCLEKFRYKFALQNASKFLCKPFSKEQFLLEIFRSPKMFNFRSQLSNVELILKKFENHFFCHKRIFS